MAMVVVQGVGVAFMAETVVRRSGAPASLRPHFDLPPPTRRPLLVVGPVLFAAWALGGFVGTLGPSLVRMISGSDSLVMGGLALFVLAGAGALSVLVLHSAPPVGFQGAIRSVLPLAPPEHRAGVMSVIYLISYLALSLPAVVAGAVVVRTGGLELTAVGYGIAVILLATLAFAGLAGSSHDPARPPCTGFHQNRPLRAG